MLIIYISYFSNWIDIQFFKAAFVSDDADNSAMMPPMMLILTKKL